MGLITAVSDPADGLSRMPDVNAKTKRQALAMLAPLRVGLEMVGRGLVVHQEPAAGTPVDPDTTVRLTLASPMAIFAGAGSSRPLFPARQSSRPPDIEIARDGDQ
jgi:beta-lactam-binding protein with PASTA domain